MKAVRYFLGAFGSFFSFFFFLVFPPFFSLSALSLLFDLLFDFLVAGVAISELSFPSKIIVI
jgi:hypothetical protein